MTTADPVSAIRPQPGKPIRGRNYFLLLIGGGVYLVALQFGNPQLVLPWISNSAGIAPVFVALIVPGVQLGQVLGQLLLGPGLAHLRIRKWALILADLGFAFATGLAALAATALPQQSLGFVMVACAVLIGMCWGLYMVAHQDLLTKATAQELLGRLMSYRAALGGLLTMSIAASLHFFAPDLARDHGLLLWAAVGLWCVAALIYVPIDEMPQTPRAKEPLLSELRRGFALLRKHVWFQDFLTGRILLLTTELAIPFYTIYVASLHDPTAQNLIVFVFAVSFGLVLGGPLWGRLTSHSPNLVMSLGAWLMATAGFVTLVLDQVVQLQVPYFHALTFTFLALGRTGVIQGRQFYISTRAPQDDRPIYISVADALMSAAGIGIALFLGWAAQLTDIFNPLLGLIALNMTAAIFALEVLRQPPASTETGDPMLTAHDLTGDPRHK